MTVCLPFLHLHSQRHSLIEEAVQFANIIWPEKDSTEFVFSFVGSGADDKNLAFALLRCSCDGSFRQGISRQQVFWESFAEFDTSLGKSDIACRRLLGEPPVCCFGGGLSTHLRQGSPVLGVGLHATAR